MLKSLSALLVLTMGALLLISGCNGVSDVDCSQAQDCKALCEPLALSLPTLLLSNETETSETGPLEYANCLSICAGCGPAPETPTDAWQECIQGYLATCYGPIE